MYITWTAMGSVGSSRQIRKPSLSNFEMNTSREPADVNSVTPDPGSKSTIPLKSPAAVDLGPQRGLDVCAR
jgi:hypothetical protein